MKTPSYEELAQRYRGLPQEELLALHASGEVTETAYAALEAELVARGIVAPTRPERPNTPQPRSAPRSIRVVGFAAFALFFGMIWNELRPVLFPLFGGALGRAVGTTLVFGVPLVTVFFLFFPRKSGSSQP